MEIFWEFRVSNMFNFDLQKDWLEETNEGIFYNGTLVEVYLERVDVEL